MRALLVTIGTLGDLHPFIAIGQALVRQGVDVRLAVPLDHVAKVEVAGLAAAAILPSFADICAGSGSTRPRRYGARSTTAISCSIRFCCPRSGQACRRSMLWRSMPI